MKLGEIENFLGFDTETTGVNVKQDRILSASLVWSISKAIVSETTWINPGVPISEGATKIHGITDEKIKEVGGEPVEALGHVRDEIYKGWENGAVLVAHNLTYDASILNYELQRHDLGNFEIKGPVVDTMVLFRMLGNKKATLDFATKHYGVINKTAHSSESDTMATLDLLFCMLDSSVWLREKDVRELYADQRVSHRNWAGSMKTYFNKIGKSFDSSGEWPLEG